MFEVRKRFKVEAYFKIVGNLILHQMKQEREKEKQNMAEMKLYY